MPSEGRQEKRAAGFEEGRAERSRPVWAIVLGALMALAGLVVLGHVLVATVVSVVFLGWVAVLGGLAGIVASLYRLGKPGFWPTLLGATLALVVGIAFLRRPGLSVVGLTLLLALMLLVGGLTRIIGGIVEHDVNRGWVIANGVISLLLGLLILFGWPGSTLWVLGTFLGVYLIVEGVTFIVLGFAVRLGPTATT